MNTHKKWWLVGAALVVTGLFVVLDLVVLPRDGGLEPGQSATCPSGRDLIIAAMDLTGDGHGSVQELRPGKKARELVPGWVASEPSISPDGARVVVNRATGDGAVGNGPIGADLWVVGVDGSDPLQLTAGGTAMQPSWSPDGRSILYLGSDEGEDSGFVATLPADGRGTPRRLRVVQVSRSGKAASPQWSPDGSRIAFAGEGEDGDVVLMDADGGNERTIGVEGNVVSVVWDPGDETLTVTTIVGDDRDWLVKRVDLATGQQSALGPGYRARWSRDGERLYLLDLNSNGSRIWMANVIEGAEPGPGSAKDIDPPLQLDPDASGLMDFDIGPCA